MVELLLAHGANVNHVGKDGWTPLLAAARTGKEQTIRALLQAGADKGATLPTGNGAKDIALINKKAAAAALFD